MLLIRARYIGGPQAEQNLSTSKTYQSVSPEPPKYTLCCDETVYLLYPILILSTTFLFTSRAFGKVNGISIQGVRGTTNDHDLYLF